MTELNGALEKIEAALERQIGYNVYQIQCGNEHHPTLASAIIEDKQTLKLCKAIRDAVPARNTKGLDGMWRNQMVKLLQTIVKVD